MRSAGSLETPKVNNPAFSTTPKTGIMNVQHWVYTMISQVFKAVQYQDFSDHLLYGLQIELLPIEQYAHALLRRVRLAAHVTRI
jgi:hypothetical protein